MASRNRKLIRSVAPLALVPLCACFGPPVASPRTTVTQETNVRVQQNLKNKVDVLFMVDNSSSMDPMQLELRARFGDFFKVFEDLAASGTFADLHIGVVTSDYGAGDAGGGGCDPYGGGQRGFLQTLPSPKAINPPANCMAPTGAPFISYKFNDGAPPTTNLPNGSDTTALVSEFTCMASVGAAGCGFEHQLESVYQALRNTKENAGFLRDDALLTVVFVTNEDDGSAPPQAKFYEQTNDPAGTNMYGQYATYRQTRFAVDCGGMQIPYGMPVGPLTGCAAAPNPMNADPSTAFDISRYISFFTLAAAQGGVKVDPQDVILVGIDGPESPFETILYDPAQGNAPYHACPTPMLSQNCTEALQHSCENGPQPGFFADPPVRLNAVINSVMNHKVASICGDDLTKAPDYTNAMHQLGELIGGHLKPACINAPVANRADDGTPDCIVEDVTANPNGTTTTVEIPSCAENGNTTPCWQLDDLLAQYQMQGCVPPPGPAPPSCKLPLDCQPVTNPVDGKQQLASVSINRGGQMPPANTTARVSCATVASSM
jgi:hypothetical protein